MSLNLLVHIGKRIVLRNHVCHNIVTQKRGRLLEGIDHLLDAVRIHFVQKRHLLEQRMKLLLQRRRLIVGKIKHQLMRQLLQIFRIDFFFHKMPLFPRMYRTILPATPCFFNRTAPHCP